MSSASLFRRTDKYRFCLDLDLDLDFTTEDSIIELEDTVSFLGLVPLLVRGGSEISATFSGIDPKVCLKIGGGIVESDA